MINFLHSLRRWLELLLVIAILALVAWFIWFKPPHVITLPGQTHTQILDPKQYIKSLEEKLNKIDELSKKINDLEVIIRKQQEQVITHDIPEALSEKDLRKSSERMREVW